MIGAALVIGAAIPAATPSERPGVDSVTVSLSNANAGVRPVALTVKLRTELQCGRLTGPVTIGLPAGAVVPRTIRASTVLFGRREASNVSVAGHAVTVTAPLPAGPICLVLATGTATIALTRAAGIGNPSSPGRYAVTVRYRGEKLVATMRIV